ncbi:chemotaxis protein CheA [Polyangium jinanense]|uniref:histidine kinase n=1 Tax=Polyangium jinanense TaxID=2829994 RepID=A0A9X4AUX6_9BACT|nr:chemotaxis protein CheA [Polyangium jinanense]MDC3959305.1 chemotaxis protein CheA [Polyangium jinanense]MDC3985714.1 chemotaxis protein CheA [Polyangium jinanense]
MTSESERAREEFFSEAQEIVEGLGRDLLALDEAQKSGHVDPDLINDVFRAVHTLKGLAGLFGATRMSSLSHKLEELLDDLRLGKVDVTAPVLDLLFLSVQLYGKLLQAEKEGRDQPMPELEKLLAQLDRGASTGGGGGSGGHIIDPNLLAVLTEFEEHKLKTNIAQGNTLYRLKVRFQLATIDQGLDELKATAKPHGDIITYLPASDGDDIDSITLEILMGSRASAGTLRNALHHLGVEVEELPRQGGGPAPAPAPAPAVSAPVPAHHIPTPTPSPPPVAPSGTPSAMPPLGHAPLDMTAPHPFPAPRLDTSASIPPKAQELGTIKSVAQTVRVDIQKLDVLMNIVGELSIVRTELERLLEKMRDAHTNRELRINLHRLQRDFERNVISLRRGILEVRMVPLGQVFDKLARVARQISREAGKQVNLVITGAETEVDKLIVEELSDPLMHMMRNAIDHGIEEREMREAVNKPAVGTIALNAFQKGNHVVIEIEDDGKGIDTERLLEKAIRMGVVQADEARTMSRREVLNLIFVPGLSTKSSVSEISGRGVGMDVVKTNISKLGGVIDVQSEPGIGTKFTVTLPITLAIISALIVKVSDQQFAIPLANVQEAVWLDVEAVRVIDGREAVTLRGSTLQLCYLARLFGLSDTPDSSGTGPFGTSMGMDAPPMGHAGVPPRGSLRSESIRQDYAAAAFPYRPAGSSSPSARTALAPRQKRRFIVVTAVGTRRLGLVVDSLVGEQDVVIKGLGPSLKNVAGFAGATQLADQRIALVLDAPALVEEMFAHADRARMHGGTHGF